MKEQHLDYISVLGNNVPPGYFLQCFDNSFCLQGQAKEIVLGHKESLLSEENDH